jgi:hypothetical protein
MESKEYERTIYDTKNNEEESSHIITLIDEEKTATEFDSPTSKGTPGKSHGISLDLSAFNQADTKNSPYNNMLASKFTSAEDSILIQEKSILIVFELPDGSQSEQNFKYGHTVEVLKSYVEDEFGIPMNEQTLYLDEKKLENPFSLLDYPEVKGN